jgi:flagellar basal body-associated protein FliL
MELAPRYCRSCGSRILLKNVCHSCNNDPIKGENYCYDCGALTPIADSCIKCGAKYKRKFQVKPILIMRVLLLIACALAGYLLSTSNKKTIKSGEDEPVAETPALPQVDAKELPVTNNTVVNNPVDTSRIITNRATTDTSVISVPQPDTIKKTTTNIFTTDELKAYKIKCTYFSKKQKSQVLFFVGSGSAYIKMNENIYELKRKRKGVDEAVFTNDEFEAKIIIDGLGGSSSEWLASCTLIIKNIVQNTSERYKVYSACIEL